MGKLVSIFFPINKINLTLKSLTKLNCLLVKKLISEFYKGKIIIKNPNDLLINKKKNFRDTTRNIVKI